jgi:hypothetical protein
MKIVKASHGPNERIIEKIPSYPVVQAQNLRKRRPGPKNFSGRAGIPYTEAW